MLENLLKLKRYFYQYITELELNFSNCEEKIIKFL
jgi:hypothetical protein